MSDGLLGLGFIIQDGEVGGHKSDGLFVSGTGCGSVGSVFTGATGSMGSVSSFSLVL